MPTNTQTDRQQDRIEVFTRAMEASSTVRTRLALNEEPTTAELDEAMNRIGRAFSLCWDLRYNEGKVKP